MNVERSRGEYVERTDGAIASAIIHSTRARDRQALPDALGADHPAVTQRSP